MQQDFSPLNVAEEVNPQANPLRGSFNQTWHIGHDKFLIVIEFDHTQVRGQGRKLIVCDFRFGITNDRQEGRFPYTWVTYQAYIGQNLQF